MEEQLEVVKVPVEVSRKFTFSDYTMENNFVLSEHVNIIE